MGGPFKVRVQVVAIAGWGVISHAVRKHLREGPGRDVGFHVFSVLSVGRNMQHQGGWQSADMFGTIVQMCVFDCSMVAALQALISQSKWDVGRARS